MLNSGKFGELTKGFTIDVGDVTYTVSRGVVVEAVNWKSDEAKQALAKYKSQYGDDEAKAKAAILKDIQSYLDGEGQTGELTVTDIVQLRHNTLIKTETKGSKKNKRYVIGPNGEKHYEGENDEVWEKIISEQILKDQQGIGDNAKFSVDGKTATVTYGQKVSVKMQATVDADGKVTWKLDGDYSKIPGLKGFSPSKSAATQDALLDEMYKWANEHTTDKDGNTVKFPTKEAWVYQTFGIHLKVKTEVYKGEGKDKVQVEDPTKDPQFRRVANQAIQDQDWTLDQDGEGKTLIKLKNGYSIQVDTDDITVDGKTDSELVKAKIREAMGLDDALKDTITTAIIDAFRALPEALKQLEGTDTKQLSNIATELEKIGSKALEAKGPVEALGEAIANIFNLFGAGVEFPKVPNPPRSPQNEDTGGSSSSNESESGAEGNTSNSVVGIIGEITSIDVSGLAQTAVDLIGKIISVEPPSEQPTVEVKENIVPEGEPEQIKDQEATLKQIYQTEGDREEDITNQNATYTIRNEQEGVRAADIKDQSATYTVKYRTIGTPPSVPQSYGATGNFGLAKAQGTLMGELGPELVVSNGRYFVAGQNGPEMVSLSKDAIVFNHLQTKSLLEKGMSSGRGKAVTNERTAVAFATGNINGGPAMASASAALAALKQLRAMWESLKNASVSDLGGAGGGGGGGGNNKIVDPKAWVDTVERWYNLTQKIAELEQEITYQQKIRDKIQSDFQKDGAAYYRSQKLSLNAINDQIKAQEELNVGRKDYFQKRVENLKKENLGKIYTFDEDGQLQFRKDTTINGKKGGMEFLTDLYGFNNLGKANYTNKEKYEILKNSGFIDYMKYDSNGMEIKVGGEGSEEDWETFYEKATQAFRDRMDQYAEATQSLRDEIKKGEETLEGYEKDRNELLKDMRDNQMAVEEKVLAAIEEARQREIDALQNERDALEESVGKYIDGLSDALDKEQKMYEDQDAQDELNRNKRRLAILQRSGGSVTDINKLQSEIRDQERELYFDAQQAQIDAIQEASDKEIERLDNQIDIMTQQLEYQKQYGLLWGDVYEVMNRSAEFITSFIQGNTAEYWSSSPLATAEKVNETLFQAEAWREYATDIEVIAEESRANMKERDYKAFDQAMKAQYGENYDPNDEYKKLWEGHYNGHKSLSEATKAVSNKIAKDKEIADRQAQANKYGVPYKGSGEWAYTKYNQENHYAHHYQKNDAGEWIYQSTTTEAHSWNGDTCTKCGEKKLQPITSSKGSSNTSSSSSSSKKTVINQTPKTTSLTYAEAQKSFSTSSQTAQIVPYGQYKNDQYAKQNSANSISKNNNAIYVSDIKKKQNRASGGYVNHGLYELGELGTETVLTAEQTQVLRNNILSNRPSSLISLLKTYNEGFSRMNTPLTGETLTDNSTNIENVSINMNVQQISNDYDARRAGEQAMNEIMRIARKTSAANSIRR